LILKAFLAVQGRHNRCTWGVWLDKLLYSLSTCTHRSGNRARMAHLHRNECRTSAGRSAAIPPPPGRFGLPI